MASTQAYVNPDSVLARTAREMLEAHAGGAGPSAAMSHCPLCGQPLPCASGQAAAEVLFAAGLAESSGLTAATRQNLGLPTGTGYDRLESPAGYDRPDHAVGYDRPDHAVGYDRPDHAVGYDRPDHAVGYDRPDHAARSYQSPLLDEPPAESDAVAGRSDEPPAEQPWWSGPEPAQFGAGEPVAGRPSSPGAPDPRSVHVSFRGPVERTATSYPGHRAHPEPSAAVPQVAHPESPAAEPPPLSAPGPSAGDPLRRETPVYDLQNRPLDALGLPSTPRRGAVEPAGTLPHPGHSQAEPPGVLPHRGHSQADSAGTPPHRGHSQAESVPPSGLPQPAGGPAGGLGQQAPRTAASDGPPVSGLGLPDVSEAGSSGPGEAESGARRAGPPSGRGPRPRPPSLHAGNTTPAAPQALNAPPVPPQALNQPTSPQALNLPPSSPAALNLPPSSPPAVNPPNANPRPVNPGSADPAAPHPPSGLGRAGSPPNTSKEGARSTGRSKRPQLQAPDMGQLNRPPGAQPDTDQSDS